MFSSSDVKQCRGSHAAIDAHADSLEALLELLRDFGIEYAQGYYWGQPG